MAATSASSSRVVRSRSPRYPGISLDIAIQRAKMLYDREARHAAPIAAIVGAWGLTPGTSSSNGSVATLKRFGLLADEGSGENRLAHLTDLALDILLNPQPEASIRKAALLPPIHQELYEKYGTTLPSDHSLKHELIMTRGFTESGADDFIRQFRRTLTFAHLEDASQEAEQQSGSTGREQGQPVPQEWPAAQVRPQMPWATLAVDDEITIPIPLSGGGSVKVSGQFPISEAAWQQLLRVLEAMKPGLVAEPSRERER